MTKQHILEYFKDINLVYNDCTKYDTLKMMLDKLTERKVNIMTKDIVSKIIYKHYVALGKAVKLNKKEIAIAMTRNEIKELHAITILAYYYLTGEDLQERSFDDANSNERT